jgi:hypothetical protein
VPPYSASSHPLIATELCNSTAFMTIKNAVYHRVFMSGIAKQQSIAAVAA